MLQSMPQPLQRRPAGAVHAARHSAGGRRRMTPVVLVLSLVLSPAASSNQRVLLREAYSVGDVVEVRNEVQVRMRIETRGSKIDTVAMQQIYREIYRTEITDVDAKGIVRGFRRTYLRHRKDSTDTAARTEVSSLEGKTVDARMAGKEIRVESQGGQLT